MSETSPAAGQGRASAEETVNSIIRDTAAAAEIESAHARDAVPLVDITTLLRSEPTEEAIADEAKKGYDMLLVGVEPAATVQGEIDEKVARVSQAFEGPLAIAVARGPIVRNLPPAPISTSWSRLPVPDIRDVAPRSL